MEEGKADEMDRRFRSYGRHMSLKSYTGLPTFFRSNFCEDWRQVDLALVGLPSDAGRPRSQGGNPLLRNS